MMRLIHRHKQSFFLLLIAVILLIGAFLISQQTHSGDRRPRLTVTPDTAVDGLSEVPDCSDEDSLEVKLACYVEAEQVSEALVLSLVDELMSLETDMARRIEFMETQIAWEESRDADCAFVRGAANDADEGKLQELICRTERNLARLKQLERYRCEWYDTGVCEDDGADES